MDLTPRTSTTLEEPAPPPRPRRRRWVPLLVLGLVIVAGAVVVTKFLTSAIDYYCNVDEIGVRDGCDANRRLRVQGTVDEGSVAEDGAATVFTISFNGKTIPVRYEGDPGGIFEECVPVVVHGRLVDGTFEGDRVEVKHSNEYVEENPDRVEPGKSPACSPSA